MTSKEFYDKYWKTVRSSIVDSFLPLNKALEPSGILSTEFFEFVDDNADLASEWEQAQAWLQQAIVSEMINVYSYDNPDDQWGSKKLKLRIESLGKILDTIENSKNKNAKVPRIVVEYDDK